MGRPRKVIDPNSPPPTTAELALENGVIFINNFPNREFTTGAGKKFKFTGTRQIFTDAEEIAALKQLAKDPDSRIFQFIDPDPEPAPTPDPEPLTMRAEDFTPPPEAA